MTATASERLPAARAVAAAAERISAAGSGSPRLDAELLVAHLAGCSRARLVTEPDLPVDAAALEALITRREAREPIAYIVGHKGFRHIELGVDRRVLIPRPETELLVEAALGLGGNARVHDVGTGSGAVALALKQERPDLHVTASDSSEDAVAVARANAAALGLDVEISLAAFVPDGEYDLVVANLPYVRDDEWDRLCPDIRLHEPRDALTAGADGLDAIRALVASAPAGTALALEHAPTQAARVRALLASGAATRSDLAGRDRVTIGIAP